MKVKNIHIRDFRGIQDMNLEFDPQLNVIVGNNGYGKSTILDVLAILLSRLISRIRSTTGTGRFFDPKDIRYGSWDTSNEISIIMNEKLITWNVSKSKRNKKNKQQITNQNELREIADTIQNKLDENPELNIPLAVYYSVNRAVLDVPLRIKQSHDFSQLSAYDQALTGARNDFRLFFEWFRNREDYENEQRLTPVEHVDKKWEFLPPPFEQYRDPQLQAVRTAINNLTEFNNIRVKRQPLRLEAKKGSRYFDIKQLSDGEKCLLAMVGDLARRLAITNPSLDEPLLGEGVVLIDEIDLHLHPDWQRMVIPGLTKTFPNCQFIVSTHSPQVLADVQPENIIILTKDGNYERAADSYGWNSDCILEDIMGTTARPAKAEKDLNKLFKLIKEKKIKDAKKVYKAIDEKYGRFPELSKADVLIRHLEIKKG